MKKLEKLRISMVFIQKPMKSRKIGNNNDLARKTFEKVGKV